MAPSDPGEDTTPAGPLAPARTVDPVDVDHAVVDDTLSAVADRPDVTVTGRRREVSDPQRFEAACERYARLRGRVIVDVVADGELLLVRNDWLSGWGAPGGGVEPGEDWATAAVREVREETGVEVAIERPLAVVGRVMVHGDQLVREPYDVEYLARPVGDRAVAEDPGVEDEAILAVDWFETMPDRAHDPDRLRDLFARFGTRSD